MAGKSSQNDSELLVGFSESLSSLKSARVNLCLFPACDSNASLPHVVEGQSNKFSPTSGQNYLPSSSSSAKINSHSAIKLGSMTSRLPTYTPTSYRSSAAQSQLGASNDSPQQEQSIGRFGGLGRPIDVTNGLPITSSPCSTIKLSCRSQLKQPTVLSSPTPLRHLSSQGHRHQQPREGSTFESFSSLGQVNKGGGQVSASSGSPVGRQIPVVQQSTINQNGHYANKSTNTRNCCPNIANSPTTDLDQRSVTIPRSSNQRIPRKPDCSNSKLQYRINPNSCEMNGSVDANHPTNSKSATVSPALGSCRRSLPTNTNETGSDSFVRHWLLHTLGENCSSTTNQVDGGDNSVKRQHQNVNSSTSFSNGFAQTKAVSVVQPNFRDATLMPNSLGSATIGPYRAPIQSKTMTCFQSTANIDHKTVDIRSKGKGDIARNAFNHTESDQKSNPDATGHDANPDSQTYSHAITPFVPPVRYSPQSTTISNGRQSGVIRTSNSHACLSPLALRRHNALNGRLKNEATQIDSAVTSHPSTNSPICIPTSPVIVARSPVKSTNIDNRINRPLTDTVDSEQRQKAHALYIALKSRHNGITPSTTTPNRSTNSANGNTTSTTTACVRSSQTSSQTTPMMLERRDSNEQNPISRMTNATSSLQLSSSVDKQLQSPLFARRPTNLRLPSTLPMQCGLSSSRDTLKQDSVSDSDINGCLDVASEASLPALPKLNWPTKSRANITQSNSADPIPDKLTTTLDESDNCEGQSNSLAECARLIHERIEQSLLEPDDSSIYSTVGSQFQSPANASSTFLKTELRSKNHNFPESYRHNSENHLFNSRDISQGQRMNESSPIVDSSTVASSPNDASRKLNKQMESSNKTIQNSKLCSSNGPVNQSQDLNSLHEQSTSLLCNEIKERQLQVQKMKADLAQKARVVSAYEQSLNHMSQRLEALNESMTGDKSPDLAELQSKLDALHIDPLLSTSTVQIVSNNKNVNGFHPRQDFASTQSTNAQPSSTPTNCVVPSINQPSGKKNGWLRSSFGKAFGKKRSSNPSQCHYPKDTVSDNSTHNKTQCSIDKASQNLKNHNIVESAVRLNGLYDVSSTHYSVNGTDSKSANTKTLDSGIQSDYDTVAANSSANSFPELSSPIGSPVKQMNNIDNNPIEENHRGYQALVNELSHLRIQLTEKDQQLTDMRLTALASAHQVEQLNDRVVELNRQLEVLKVENESLKRSIDTPSQSSSNSPTKAHENGLNVNTIPLPLSSTITPIMSPPPSKFKASMMISYSDSYNLPPPQSRVGYFWLNDIVSWYQMDQLIRRVIATLYKSIDLSSNGDAKSTMSDRCSYTIGPTRDGELVRRELTTVTNDPIITDTYPHSVFDINLLANPDSTIQIVLNDGYHHDGMPNGEIPFGYCFVHSISPLLLQNCLRLCQCHSVITFYNKVGVQGRNLAESMGHLLCKSIGSTSHLTTVQFDPSKPVDEIVTRLIEELRSNFIDASNSTNPHRPAIAILPNIAPISLRLWTRIVRETLDQLKDCPLKNLHILANWNGAHFANNKSHDWSTIDTTTSISLPSQSASTESSPNIVRWIPVGFESRSDAQWYFNCQLIKNLTGRLDWTGEVTAHNCIQLLTSWMFEVWTRIQHCLIDPEQHYDIATYELERLVSTDCQWSGTNQVSCFKDTVSVKVIRLVEESVVLSQIVDQNKVRGLIEWFHNQTAS